MTVTLQQVADFEYGCQLISGQQRCWFKIYDTKYYTAEWSVWRVQNGRTVYISANTYGDSGRLYLWAFHRTDGTLSPYTTPHRTNANIFLSNPTLWESTEEARIIRAHQSGSLFGGIVDAISNAVSDVGHVVSDVVDFGIQVNLAALHPLTVNSNGLQLSSSAIALVPDQVQGLAQTITSIGGYAVLAAAGVTALGGIGAVTDAVSTGVSAVQSAAGVVSGVAGAVSTATGLASAVGLLPGPSFISTDQAAQAGASTPSVLPLLALAAIAYLALRK